MFHMISRAFWIKTYKKMCQVLSSERGGGGGGGSCHKVIFRWYHDKYIQEMSTSRLDKGQIACC